MVFDESKGWNWDPSSSESNIIGDFKIKIGVLGIVGSKKQNKKSKNKWNQEKLII